MAARYIYSFLIGLFFCVSSVHAQVIFPSYYQKDYYDVLRMKNDIKEPITYFPSLIHEYSTDSELIWDIWEGKFDLISKNENHIKIINPFGRISYSSSYPDSYNDGAVWEGKGLNSSLNFGFSGKLGLVYFSFAPVIYSSQNKGFEIPSSPYNKNPYSYPFERRIDWVERYGNQPLTKFNLGQSEVRLVYKKFSAGISTQNFMLGPARVSPILMSNNASGIPHLDVGTSGPIETKIGNVEFKTFWGIMDESEYFDDDEDNDRRYITGAIIGYQPKFIPGLSLGLNRVMYRRASGTFGFIDYVTALAWKASKDSTVSSQSNDNYDQMASLMVNWKFKEYGFDAYIEFARNDFPGTWTDLLENPERTRGTTMGLVKTFDLNDKSLLRFLFEYTRINKVKMSVAMAGHPTYYVHSVVENGYTHLGQIMGAYSGPGSNSHHIKMQYYVQHGMFGLNIDRVRFNDDYFIATFANTEAKPNDIRYRIGLDCMKFIDNFSLLANLTYGVRRNHYYIDDRTTNNLNLNLQVGYLLN